MTDYPTSRQNRIRRLPKRAHYDRDTVHRIIDEALVCHVGFVHDGHPVVIPTLHARLGDSLLLHGAKASRLLKHVGAGHPVSVAITLLDGIVFARSVFHHSMNYRSVVLFGAGHLVEERAEKLAALEAFTEHMAGGRWKDARPPNPKELTATSVASIPIESASAKIRTGPPLDEDEDYALPVWAGVLPLEIAPRAPVRDPMLAPDVPVPGYVRTWSR